MYFTDLDPNYFDQISGQYHFFLHLQPEQHFEQSVELNFMSEENKVKKQADVNIYFQDQYSQDQNSQILPKCYEDSRLDRQILIKEQEECLVANTTRKVKKSKKNQYDKNIFANITTVVIKRILASEPHPKLQLFCQYKQFCLKKFISYFKQLQRTKPRLGTTEMVKFFSNSEIPNPLKQVFSMFLVYFLKEEYILYIIRDGKMNNKQKYLSCATKMMYIPQLSHLDYDFLNNENIQIQ